MYRRSFKPSERHEKDAKKTTSAGHQEYTSRRIDPGYVDQEGRSHLHLAVLHGGGNNRLVDHMLSAGCPVNAADSKKERPIHLAVQKEYKECLKKLLKENADLNVFNDKGLSPLMIACGNGNEDIARMLVNHGATVNLTNVEKEMALHHAAKNSNKGILELMIKSGAKLNVQDKNLRSPLLIACYQNINSSCVEYLLKVGCKPDLVDMEGNTALHYTAKYGNVETMKHLIGKKADMNKINKNNSTPFVLAIKEDNSEALELLLDSGCDSTSIDGLNGTALTVAICHGSESCVDVLLKKGHDPDEVGMGGCNPLTVAACRSSINVVRNLLDHNADPNLKNRKQLKTLVRYLIGVTKANAVERHECIALLLRANADPNNKVNCSEDCEACLTSQNSLLSYAICTGYLSLVKMFLIGGSKIKKETLDKWYQSTSCNDLYFDLKQVLKPVDDWVSKPRDLKHICRKVIRDHLGPRPLTTIPMLPIAQPLRYYLNFREFDFLVPEIADLSQKVSNVFKYVPFVSGCSLQVVEITMKVRVQGD